MSADIRGILLDGLSDEARAIVSSTRRRLLVVAGAGAGKTEAMARRIAWWHAVDGIPKDRIVAFTFTERAAEEMKFRIRKYIAQTSPSGEDPSLGGMYVGTIHSYCMNTLRKMWPREFHNDEILDDVARYALIQQGYDGILGLPALTSALSVGKPYPVSRSRTIEYFLRAYDLLNEYGRLDVILPTEPPPHIFGLAESDWCKKAVLAAPTGDDDIALAFSNSAARYYAFMRCRHFLDFSTSQSELVRRLESSEEAAAGLREATSHLVVDEVQDINVVQDRLRRAVVGDSGALTAVGDHRQAIYGWRGGRIDLMADLGVELEADADGEVLGLSANYRSTPRIVRLSNSWNETIGAPKGMASPAMTPGRLSRADRESSHVMSLEFAARDDEAAWIADSITELVQGEKGAAHDAGKEDRGITHSDIAVLVRSSTDARTYQEALRAQGIPAVVRAGPDLFAQPEVLLFASALALSAGRDTFVGASWDARSLPSRLKAELGVDPADARAAVRAAFARLSTEGLEVTEGAAERLVKVADAIYQRLTDEDLGPNRGAAATTPALRAFLKGGRKLRRVFPQRILQMLMAEAGVAAWDVDGPRGTSAMFHLGQLSSLVTGIETPGWTTPSGYRHQVTSLLLWATKEASPDESPLLVAPDAVTVSTIHSCKGLEFAAVFIADVKSARFPSNYARRVDPLPFSDQLKSELRTDLLGDNPNLDSERRLMYVALTRAERYLYVTTSKPSRFFKQLVPMLLAAGGLDGSSPTLYPNISLLPSSYSSESRLVTSFSDLRYFLECSHDFYLRKVLGFSPTIDQAFGYGRGVHNLLREIHLEPSAWAALAADRSALEARLKELIAEGMFYLRHTTGQPAELMHAKGVSVVADYVETYIDELSALSFEPEREFEVLLPEQNVLVTGAIDLVRRDDPPRVTIIDFKSGEADSDRHQALDSDEMAMQVSIYAVAAQEELQYEPEKGLVRYLGENDPDKKELQVPLTPAAIEASRSQVSSLAGEIQERRFRGTPKQRGDRTAQERCQSCDFTTLCGISLA